MPRHPVDQRPQGTAKNVTEPGAVGFIEHHEIEVLTKASELAQGRSFEMVEKKVSDQHSAAQSALT